VIITYRSNKADTLRAAYIGTVRVGYVEKRNSFLNTGWRWQLILLRPEGGAYWGFEDDEDEAKIELTKAMNHWLACAGLQPTEKRDDAGRGAHTRKGAGATKAAGAGGDRPAGEPAQRPTPKRRSAGANRS
jgi:hypothetical protein